MKEVTTQMDLSQSIYKDKKMSIEHRISDLLKKMTLEEKVRQMDQYFGADFVDKTHPKMHNCMDYNAEILWNKVLKEIGDLGVGCIHDLYGTPEVNNALQKYSMEKTRLGIPILFSEEALHGLCRPGCSIFPQQITLACTWNPDIVTKIGACIALETRSCGIQEVFSPILDLARDPRWGRMEETFGEDTYLTSRMAVALVKGLQGDDISSSESVIAEIKHFSAYGIPEGGLNCAPVRLGPHEHQSSILPIFKAVFVESGALNVMCSYSSIDGIPCAGDKSLLTGVLRDQWDMKGFVRADMCAIIRLFETHGTAESPEDAIKQAVEAGVDMQYYDFPHEFFQQSLINMVRNGDMKEETIDLSVSRILRVKFMLGLFDNPYIDPIPYKKAILNERHGEIALVASRESICLLKNEGGILPLKNNFRSIAVIGPNADQARFGDYTPVVEGFKPITVLDGIKMLAGTDTEINFVRGTGILEEELYSFPAGWLKTASGKDGLAGEYFNSRDFSGEPVLSRTDKSIEFSWVFTRPSEKLTANSYSVRWTGNLIPDVNFSGLIGTRSYDRMRLWIDDVLVIEGFGLYGNSNQSRYISFEQGKAYSVKVEYIRDVNGAQIFFGLCKKFNEIALAVKAAEKADVAILVLGESETTSGENMDRCDLNLPGIQLELLKAVYNTGTPVVLVLQNGRPLSLTWETAHIPAILETWFGGEKAGQAIAEVLFGLVNPAGRLPVSFPKSVGQLPVHYSRKPGGGVKYIENDWSPLFPFGYGLSYTSFSYENIIIEPSFINSDSIVTVKVDVKNIGEMTGDEVVQLYIHHRHSSTVCPQMELKGFQRINIEAGKTKTLSFELGLEELQVLNSTNEWVVEPGKIDVMVGPDSANIQLEGIIEVTKK